MLEKWLNALRELISSFGVFLLSVKYGKSKEKEKANEASSREAKLARKRSERNLARSDSDARERLHKIRSK